MTDTIAAPPLTKPSGTFRPVCGPTGRLRILVAAILASSMGFIDGSVTAIALPAMRQSLGADLVAAQWFGASYLLVLSALVLAGGAMGDRFGVARIFGGGIVLFVIASLACALAWDPASMIVARAVQGLGAGFMVPGSMAIIARAYPPGERGRAIGIWAAASAVTTALGPILGGALISWGPTGAWRLIFAVNLPLGAVALWLLVRNVEADPGRPGTPVDWAGAVLATLGLGLLALAMTGEAPVEINPFVVGLAGVAALALFIWHENRSAGPMLPLRLFRDRGFSAANLATFFLYFALSAVLFYLPMAAETGWGVSAAEVTLAFVPLSVTIGLLSGPAGRLADRIGTRPLMTAGSALVAAAYGGLALAAWEAAFWWGVLPAMTVAAFGMAAVVAPLSTAVMAGAGDSDSGAASGANNAVARVAGLVAVAAMGGVAASAYGASGGTAGFGAPSTSPDHATASAAAFAAVALVAAISAALSAVVSWIGLPQPAPDSARR